MIVVYRNFFRNKMVNLSYQSVMNFLPTARVFCFSFYKKNQQEYETQEPLNPDIVNFYLQTAFVSGNQITDHIDSTKTSGYQNSDNGKYFVEGYNGIFKVFKLRTESVLMLSEDHFFTNGNTLKELVSNDYDIAYAPWDNELDANGSILCLNFYALRHLFPLPVASMPIERLLQDNLITKIDNKRRYKILNRKHTNYFGDGVYTNSSEEMKVKMSEAKLI